MKVIFMCYICIAETEDKKLFTINATIAEASVTNGFNPLLEAARKIDMGRAALQWGTQLGVKIRFPRFRFFRSSNEAASYVGIINTVYVYRQNVNSISKGVALIVHELRHAKQESLRKKLSGKFGIFSRRGANYYYNELISEADAGTHEVIAAYELSLKGDGSYWATLQQRPSTINIAAALVKEVEQGALPSSDQAKQAVFHAWMISPLSDMYNIKFLREFLEHRTSILPLITGLAGSVRFSLESKDVSYIGTDASGHSYLSSLDLLQGEYCDVWKSLTSTRGIRQSIRALESKELQRFRSGCLQPA